MKASRPSDPTKTFSCWLAILAFSLAGITGARTQNITQAEADEIFRQWKFRPGETSQRDRTNRMPATKFDWGPVPRGVEIQAHGDPQEPDHLGMFVVTLERPLPHPYTGQSLYGKWEIAVKKAPRARFDEAEQMISFLRQIPKGVPGKVDYNTGEWTNWEGGQIFQGYEDDLKEGTYFGLPGVRRVFGMGKRNYDMPSGVEVREFHYFYWLDSGGAEGVFIRAYLELENTMSPPPFDVNAERQRLESFLDTFRFPDLGGGAIGIPGTGGAQTSVVFGNVPWKKVISDVLAGAAAGLAAAGLGSLLGGKNSPGKEEGNKPDPNRVVRYILNPSTDHLFLLPGDSAPLDISVWAITAGGQRQLAGDAGIELSVREESFEVVPVRGQGMLRCQIRAADAPSVFTDELVVVASGPGAGTVEAKIALGIKPKLQLIVELESFDP